MTTDLNRFENINGIGQLRGPMPNKDVYGKYINLIGIFDIQFKGKIVKLSIHAPEDTIILINNKEFIIGKTDFLEYETGTEITSLCFKSDITESCFIDFVYVV